MSESTPSAHDVFLNVRKAYRLLHDYQQMVIDAVRYISRELDINEWEAYPHLDAASSKGYWKLNDSSWAWLPMMNADFHFVNQLSETDFMTLSILVLSDTGFIEGDDGEKNKSDTTTFDEVGQSKTQFAFFLYQMHPHRFVKDLFREGQLHAFLRNGGNLGPNISGKLYDADCLCSQDRLNDVIQDILAAAQNQKLPLKLRNGMIPA